MPHSIAGHSFNIIQMNTLKIIRDLKKEEKKIFICLRIQIKLANDTKQQLDNQPKYKKKKRKLNIYKKSLNSRSYKNYFYYNSFFYIFYLVLDFCSFFLLMK